jgi:hypothetical protein
MQQLNFPHVSVKFKGAVRMFNINLSLFLPGFAFFDVFQLPGTRHSSLVPLCLLLLLLLGSLSLAIFGAGDEFVGEEP